MCHRRDRKVTRESNWVWLLKLIYSLSLSCLYFLRVYIHGGWCVLYHLVEPSVSYISSFLIDPFNLDATHGIIRRGGKAVTAELRFSQSKRLTMSIHFRLYMYIRQTQHPIRADRPFYPATAIFSLSSPRPSLFFYSIARKCSSWMVGVVKGVESFDCGRQSDQKSLRIENRKKKEKIPAFFSQAFSLLNLRTTTIRKGTFAAFLCRTKGRLLSLLPYV